MLTEEWRRRAQQRQRKAYWASISTMAIGLGLSAFFAWSFIKAQNGIPRIGLGVLSAWGIYSVYLAYRWLWPERLDPDPTIEDSVKFYKSECAQATRLQPPCLAQNGAAVVHARPGHDRPARVAESA